LGWLVVEGLGWLCVNQPAEMRSYTAEGPRKREGWLAVWVGKVAYSLPSRFREVCACMTLQN